MKMNDVRTPDMSISDELKLSLLRNLQAQIRIDYHKLLYSAKLNDLVDNDKLAEQQRDQAKKMIIQMGQVEKDISALEIAVN